MFTLDAEPTLHYPSAHFHRLSGRVLEELVAIGGIDADHQTASAAGGDGDVAVNEERNAAEHSFFADALVRVEQNTDTAGQFLVVRHLEIVA